MLAFDNCMTGLLCRCSFSSCKNNTLNVENRSITNLHRQLPGLLEYSRKLVISVTKFIAIVYVVRKMK